MKNKPANGFQLWEVKFTNGVVKEIGVDTCQTIDGKIKDYLHEQNVGEAKSDRIRFKSKNRIKIS